jgi:hypothetical protein
MFVFYRIRIQNQPTSSLNRADFRKKYCSFVTPSSDAIWASAKRTPTPFSQPVNQHDYYTGVHGAAKPKQLK